MKNNNKEIPSHPRPFLLISQKKIVNTTPVPYPKLRNLTRKVQ
jgi:hypothetical protein